MYGGRWNPTGFEVIYAAGSRSLAVLEILVHNSVLDMDYGVTEIQIAAEVAIERVVDEDLPANGSGPVYDKVVQTIGERWLLVSRSAVLSVPSSVIKQEQISY